MIQNSLLKNPSADHCTHIVTHSISTAFSISNGNSVSKFVYLPVKYTCYSIDAVMLRMYVYEYVCVVCVYMHNYVVRQ